MMRVRAAWITGILIFAFLAAFTIANRTFKHREDLQQKSKALSAEVYMRGIAHALELHAIETGADRAYPAQLSELDHKYIVQAFEELQVEVNAINPYTDVPFTETDLDTPRPGDYAYIPIHVTYYMGDGSVMEMVRDYTLICFTPGQNLPDHPDANYWTKLSAHFGGVSSTNSSFMDRRAPPNGIPSFHDYVTSEYEGLPNALRRLKHEALADILDGGKQHRPENSIASVWDQAVKTRNFAEMNRIVSLTSNADQSMLSGLTALQYAATTLDTDLARWCIQHGANLNLAFATQPSISDLAYNATQGTRTLGGQILEVYEPSAHDRQAFVDMLVTEERRQAAAETTAD